eukprot:TRINITY_DN868_c0_g1_i1.p1 TRINITY_DN868_c0_g1~~TRINITY_DN868_c0_g1_i1.p1  ORF type:complete len:273 (+),score=43.81 TRINITY_DN868_c0_g1_i1:30-821(+)
MWQSEEGWGSDEGSFYPLGGYGGQSDGNYSSAYPQYSQPDYLYGALSPRNTAQSNYGNNANNEYGYSQQQWNPAPKDFPQQNDYQAPMQQPAGWTVPYSEHINRIHNNVWQGGYQALRASVLRERGITCVINAAFELERGGGGPFIDWDDLARAGIEVLHLNWDDSPRQQIYPSETLDRALTWLDGIAAAGHNVLVNCAAGVSRSSSTVIAYLISRVGMTFDQALATCRAGRPISNPNPGFISQLRNLEYDTLGRNNNASWRW